MNSTSLRTQIILPRNLRDEIERQRKLSGESLAEYLRIAAKERLERSKKKKADLKKFADEFVGAAKGTRTKIEVEEWIREIREDRQKSDERMLKRWDEARKKSLGKSKSE
jgi:CRISPR/Cas system-associated protein Cas7 (RAMP superfamily)